MPTNSTGAAKCCIKHVYAACHLHGRLARIALRSWYVFGIVFVLVYAILHVGEKKINYFSLFPLIASALSMCSRGKERAVRDWGAEGKTAEGGKEEGREGMKDGGRER